MAPKRTGRDLRLALENTDASALDEDYQSDIASALSLVSDDMRDCPDIVTPTCTI